MNQNINTFFNEAKKWQFEFSKLRTICLDCDLTEEMKWGKPCYTYKNNNIVLIHGFKAYCALLFFKGALLNDNNGILVRQTQNTQASRQIRFTDMQEIKALEPILKAYIFEAIEVENVGLKVDFTKSKDLIFPDEFKRKLDDTPNLKIAFDALTPGRQKAYNLYFLAPKQSKTRLLRIEKCIPNILIGKGLND